MAQASSHSASAIPVYHIGQKIKLFQNWGRTNSLYHSERIQHMIKSRHNFTSEVEFDIENSRVHWSTLTDGDSASTGLAERKRFEVLKKSRQWEGFLRLMKVLTLRKTVIEIEKDEDTDMVSDRNTDMITDSSIRLTNREHFEVLKNHPEWGGFFKDVNVKLGKKINEGGQAEIYDAKVEFAGQHSLGYGYYVVKMMKGNHPLQDFQRQWPTGMMSNWNLSQDRDKGPLLWIKCGTLIDNRFGFVMVKQWGDLRTLIDLKMQHNGNQGPPFRRLKFVVKIMLCIARDMDTLHKYGIVHRDLKASNVLLWSTWEKLSEEDLDVKANVVDYECSIGVIGTGFWRAPEIFQQLKDNVPSSELVISKMSDVYSYGMTCYEILTGYIPFEGVSHQAYDLILQGKKPDLSAILKEKTRYEDFSTEDTFNQYHIIEVIESCWNLEPLDRPTFSEIVLKLENYMGINEDLFKKLEQRGSPIDMEEFSSERQFSLNGEDWEKESELSSVDEEWRSK